MSALAKLAPEFIQEGRLCWLRAPLWIVTNKKQHSYFFTDQEYEKVRGKISGFPTRNKGLGEMNPEVAKESMFDPRYQRLDILDYSEEAMKTLEDLMGTNVENRRDFIFENVDFSTITE